MLKFINLLTKVYRPLSSIDSRVYTTKSKIPYKPSQKSQLEKIKDQEDNAKRGLTIFASSLANI